MRVEHHRKKIITHISLWYPELSNIHFLYIIYEFKSYRNVNQTKKTVDWSQQTFTRSVVERFMWTKIYFTLSIAERFIYGLELVNQLKWTISGLCGYSLINIKYTIEQNLSKYIDVS